MNFRWKQSWLVSELIYQLFLNWLCYNPVFLNQLVNPATSSPADDVHHDVIPPKLLLTNRFYFQHTSGIHAPVKKRRGFFLTGRNPAPIADSSNVATIERRHNVLNLREINRNNTHTAFASGLTYYGWVSSICYCFVVTQRNDIQRYNYDIYFLDVGNGSAVIRSTYERRSLEISYGIPHWRPRAFNPQGCLHEVWCNRFGSLVQLQLWMII
jgi:hypothetical protein